MIVGLCGSLFIFEGDKYSVERVFLSVDLESRYNWTTRDYLSMNSMHLRTSDTSPAANAHMCDSPHRMTAVSTLGYFLVASGSIGLPCWKQCTCSTFPPLIHHPGHFGTAQDQDKPVWSGLPLFPLLFIASIFDSEENHAQFIK